MNRRAHFRLAGFPLAPLNRCAAATVTIEVAGPDGRDSIFTVRALRQHAKRSLPLATVARMVYHRIAAAEALERRLSRRKVGR